MNTVRRHLQEEEFRIGGIFPLTGYLSWSGEYKRKAAELKIDMINSCGGINGRKLRLITYDDRSSVEHAAIVAEALVSKHRVVAMVGTGSLPISSAVAAIANRDRIPTFLNSGYAVDPVKDVFVFNTTHKTEFVVASSFEYFKERGIDRIGLLMPSGPLGDLGALLSKRLADRLGIKIVGEERFDVKSAAITPQLNRLNVTKPLALFSFTTGEPAALVAKKMGQMGLKMPLLVSHGNANPTFLRLVSRTPVQIVVPSGKTMMLDYIPDGDPCKHIVTDFNLKHLERYGEPVNYYSAELADAVDLVAEGLRMADSDPEELRNAVEHIRAFGGMQGIYDFSPANHYGTQPEHLVVLTIRNGKWHFEKAFASPAILDNIYPNGKTMFIYKLADLFSGPPPVNCIQSDEVPEFKKLVEDNIDGKDKVDLPFVTLLYYRQKREMINAVQEQNELKAKQSLYRLLTIALFRYFERPEHLRISVLELFLALFDAAVDGGADIEELTKLKDGFSVDWEKTKSQEGLCLWIIRVLDRIMDVFFKQKQGRTSRLLQKILYFIEANYADDLTVNRIAHEVCLSPSRLIHRMRSQYGLTLGKCIAKVRIEKAKVLLKNTDMPISKISHEVGYGDQSYFTKVFKRCLNCTPKDFRDNDLKLSILTDNWWKK